MVVLAACSVAPSVAPTPSRPEKTPEPTPGPSLATFALGMSASDLRRWGHLLPDFGAEYYRAWPDEDAVMAMLAEDATFSDPTDGDLVTGTEALQGFVRTIAAAYPDLRYSITDALWGGRRGLFELEVTGIWPPWVPAPANPPPLHEVQILEIDLGQPLVHRAELAMPVAELEMFPLGCFQDNGCSAEYRQLVERYVSAWSSGDEARVAALYRDDATFDDPMLGLREIGAQEIGRLIHVRFGRATDVGFDVLRTYAQTNGYSYPTSRQPLLGAVIGIGLRYRWTGVIGGHQESLESFTLLRYANWTPAGLVDDPDGRIVEELVFHDTGSLASWLDALGTGWPAG